MFEEYIVDGTTYQVSPDRLQEFKNDFPNARSKKEINELNFKKSQVSNSSFEGDP